MDVQRVGQAFWASVILFSLIGLYFYLTQPEYDHGPTRWRRWVSRYVMSRDEARAARRGSVRNEPIYAGSKVEPEPEPEPNPALESRTEARTGAFVLNSDQQLAVTKMIYHKASNPSATKASTIKAGFGVSKGDSNRYKEASAIYDALFVLPEPNKFPQRTPEQEQARKQLGIAA